MRTRCWAVVVAVMGMQAGRALGDMGPTMFGELQNARAVLRAHVPTAREAAALPKGAGTMLIVDEVMKGLESRRFVAGPKEGLAAGQAVVVLERFDDATAYPTQTRALFTHADPEAGFWLVRDSAKGQVVEVPVWGGGWDGASTQLLDIATFTEQIVRSAPEAAWLQEKVVDVLFFPERAAALERRDAEEALFVQVVIAVRDLRRDVGWLAGFLESADGAVRAAAEKQLEKITGAKVGGQGVEAAEQWRAWWKAQGAKVAWREEAGRYEERRGSAGDARGWPGLPVDERLPAPARLPGELVAAMGGAGGKPDAAALEKAVRAFMDGGCMRDRVLDAIAGLRPARPKVAANAVLPGWAEGLLKTTESQWTGGLPERREVDVVDWACAVPAGIYGGSGPGMPWAPRLRKDVLLDGRIPAELRAQLVAKLVFAAKNSEWIVERRAVFDLMKDGQPTADEVTRAVYWEPKGDIRDYAFFKFGALADEASQRRLVKWFLEKPLDFEPAIREAVEAKHAVVVGGLLGQLKAGKGDVYRWAARVLAQGDVREAIPLLTARLTDEDANIREWTEFALHAFPARGGSGGR